MTKLKTTWECECGSIAYGKLPPEECSRCGNSDCFIAPDEDQIGLLAEENLIREIRPKDMEDEE